MDFNLTEEQEMLRTMARDFLTTECPKSLVREMAKDEKGYPPQLSDRLKLGKKHCTGQYIKGGSGWPGSFQSSTSKLLILSLFRHILTSPSYKL